MLTTTTINTKIQPSNVVFLPNDTQQIIENIELCFCNIYKYFYLEWKEANNKMRDCRLNIASLQLIYISSEWNGKRVNCWKCHVCDVTTLDDTGTTEMAHLTCSILTFVSMCSNNLLLIYCKAYTKHTITSAYIHTHFQESGQMRSEQKT